jgi:hypothetical protein
MARLYKPDGTQEDVQPRDGQKFTLEEAQKLVGGYVQTIKLNGSERLVFDEDGRPKGLPVNPEASALLQSYSDRPTVALVGNVLFGSKKEFGLG